MDRKIALVVLVAALGYFVDTYDLLLFGILRVPSLTDLGLSGKDLLSTGVFLLNTQMAAIVLGGILWGIWGDKRGRVSVLFGSITLYSVANIANGFVHSVNAYAACRFFAGLGLAGELGAGITLVSEIMDQYRRGLGTTLVASVGVGGVVAAALVGDLFPWRISYFIGGGLGLGLLALRIFVHESGMFDQLKAKQVRRGDLLLLFASRERALRYLKCILSGVPIWYAVGILITFAPEFGKEFNMLFLPSAGKAILYTYIGLVLGDFSSGLLSQIIKSRKKVMMLYLLITAVGCLKYLSLKSPSLFEYFCVCALVGFGVGYWAVFVTSAAEQFGTNLRATVATTVPNFVRGAVVPLTISFRAYAESVGIINSAMLVGLASIVIAILASASLRESYGANLDYLED